jgi:isocitrate lyase
VWFCHIPNGGARTAIEGAIFKALGVRPGAPDLLIVRAGQALFIECKAPGRKLSASQVECHEALRRAGAAVETADSIDQALGFLKRHGAADRFDVRLPQPRAQCGAAQFGKQIIAAIDGGHGDPSAMLNVMAASRAFTSAALFDLWFDKKTSPIRPSSKRETVAV